MYPALRNKLLVVISVLLLVQEEGLSQSKAGIELYRYNNGPSIQPLCHIQSTKNWYAELRYNYEDEKTFSAYGGRTFQGGKAFEYSLTPMAGISLGQFSGVSIAANADAEWKSWFISSQSQYSFATKNEIASFFFNWSELGYSFTDHVFAGATLQYTMDRELNSVEPGFLFGLSTKNISFPMYIFKPFNNNRYFVLGINVEYNIGKK